jgi:light-harvesting protein B-800-850 alpha chain
VHPTVGLPLFLGSVAITSFIVHASVMTHTTWMSTYWQGAKARTASADLPLGATASKLDSGYTVSVLPSVAGGTNAQPGFTITVTPVAVTTATAEPAKVLDTTTVPFKAASTQ